MGQDVETEMLLGRIGGGDDAAAAALLAGHRRRLRQMIAIRLDPRLSARLDPSDVLQEVFAEASRRLAEYARRRPIPFYPWLRRIAWERLVKLHERHLYRQKRAATRDIRLPMGDQSSMLLAEYFIDSGTSPSRQVLRVESRARVQAALAQMPERDRELLVLRYLEQLSMAEIATVMDSTEGAVKVRHLRALERFRGILGEDSAK
jgi:RNA polymerase sigma-70 factor (ECF subfamily)